MKCQNPFAFRPVQVSFWTTIIYLAVTIPLIYVHEAVPNAPSDRSLYRGLNLTEAWRDLQTITTQHHPFNSRANDQVRKYLLERSELILKQNKADYAVQTVTEEHSFDEESGNVGNSSVVVFDDRLSNYTMIRPGGFLVATPGTYYEGSNLFIYIRGTDDPEGDWWRTETSYNKARRSGGVLVNCHFDSVSTGYGATDDGMGCVSLLQLLSYYTTGDNKPKNGIVLLFNNGEEDGLYGAYAFGKSPFWQFAHTFVNLEGAGAGGRAMLFRATDLEVAQAYAKSPYPFGSVVAADAFERGVIKSGTDYSVFYGIFGQRGVDIAFYAPRARYHTADDDSRHTSVNSIWHMLSAALATTEQLSRTTGSVFNGDRGDGNADKVQNGKATRGVWFDFFGQAWATFALRGLFAWSLTLLVAAPLVLFVVTYLLTRQDKYYFFARDIKIHSELNEDPVRIGGWKGFFRFPLAFVISGALTILSAFLVAKVNPFIVYSSAYAVWAMSISLFYFVAWLILRGASFVRPTALQRGFATVWLFILGWVVQVLAAVAEDRWHLSALYSAAILQSAVFVSVLISLLEMFQLPGKHEFAHQLHDAHQARDQTNHGGGNHHHAGEGDTSEDTHEDDEPEPTETTPLRAGEQDYGSNDQPTFANTYRQSVSAPAPSAPTKRRAQPYDREQSWSGRLPNWTWFIQFILLAPVPVILIGNLGLVAMSAMHMTGTDGSNPLNPLLAIAVFSILILLPIMPFIHRVSHHVPLFLLLVFIATFIYNLAAFPFSVDNRFKFFFIENIDLDKGTNSVTLIGIEEYVRPVIASLPAASGQEIKCGTGDSHLKSTPTNCSYDASTLPPHLVKQHRLEDLLKVNVPKRINGSAVSILVDALDTRMCTIDLSRPIFDFSVEGGSVRDPRYGARPNGGFSSIQLWRRSWDKPWNVTMDLVGDSKLVADQTSGKKSSDSSSLVLDELKPRLSPANEPLELKVSCSYSDVNEPNTVPAFHELRRYMPPWAVVSKRRVGLVEVTRTYKIKP